MARRDFFGNMLELWEGNVNWVKVEGTTLANLQQRKLNLIYHYNDFNFDHQQPDFCKRNRLT